MWLKGVKTHVVLSGNRDEKLHVCENQLIEVVHDIQFIWLNFSVKQTPF